MAISITQEQAAALLPLLPHLVAQVPAPAGSTRSSEEQMLENMKEIFSAAEMLTRKKKNTKSTSAQRYLLTIVRESAKAANIWENPPLMRNLTPAEAAKFYDTAFTLCPQLKSSRHLLTTRLSKTLINRRQLLRRLGKLNAAPPRQPLSRDRYCLESLNFSDVSGKENNNQCSMFGESGSSPGNNEKENSQSSTMPLSQETNLPVNLHQSSSLDLADISGPSGRKSIGSGVEVAILKADTTRIGKGLFLRMKSNETYEQFGEVLFMSAQKFKGTTAQVELAAETENGKQCFSELERGDIFLWKISRLQPLANADQVTKKTKINVSSRLHVSEEHDNESAEETEDDGEIESDDDHDEILSDKIDNLSEYEIRRMHRIAENKKRFQEHYKAITVKEVKPTQKTTRHTYTFCQGDHVAVNCNKYDDRPLIGKITALDYSTNNATIEWYVGTYSGTWKQWRGRKDGKAVIFTDVIPFKNILTKVHFTKSMRLPSKIISTVKDLY